MTTIGDLCTFALRDSGVIGGAQVPSAEDSNTALRLANSIVPQWNRKRNLIYNLLDLSIRSTGAQSYTVGPGGDFDTPRPDRLEDGNYLRQLTFAPQAILDSNGNPILDSDGNPILDSGSFGINNAVDYPLVLIPSHEDYDRIRLKTMGTWPSVIFYDSGWPLGRVFPWPVPLATNYELHILVKNQLAQFTDLTIDLAEWPPEYETALLYTLQVRLRAAYRLPVDPVIVAIAKDALNTIRLANVQTPRMRMPASVLGARRGYNVFSDGYG